MLLITNFNCHFMITNNFMSDWNLDFNLKLLHNPEAWVFFLSNSPWKEYYTLLKKTPMQLLLHFSNDTLTHTMLSILMFLVLNNNKMSKELCVFFFLRVKHACIIGTIFHPIKSTCREFVFFVLLLYFVCFSPIVCLDLLLC